VSNQLAAGTLLEREPTRDPRKAHMPLNVAIVDEELPYPPTSGKGIRTLNLILIEV
jgi:hypothetical protein